MSDSLNDLIVVFGFGMIIVTFTFGAMYAVSTIQENTPSAMPDLSDITETPHPTELGITEVIVKDCRGNIRSVSILDERTGDYRHYISDNMTNSDCYETGNT